MSSAVMCLTRKSSGSRLQVAFAERIRREANVMTGAVG